MLDLGYDHGYHILSLSNNSIFSYGWDYVLDQKLGKGIFPGNRKNTKNMGNFRKPFFPSFCTDFIVIFIGSSSPWWDSGEL